MDESVSIGARAAPRSRTGGLLIGFDLGTSAMKGLLASPEGDIVGRTCRDVNLLRPRDSIVELDPEVYFRDVCAAVRELVEQAGGSASIQAVSFSGATGNTVLLDANYIPLANAISWLDTRTQEALWPEIPPERLYRVAGWPFTGTFPLAHLIWYRRCKPAVWAKARHFALLDDYLYYRLCGRIAVDHSKATTFYLQDQEARAWNTELLHLLGIDAGYLPELLPSGVVCGTVCEEAARATGLRVGTLVVTGAFDHPSAARSTGVFEEGDMLISTGTSWVLFAPIGRRETGLRGKMLVDPFLSPSGCWGAMAAVTAVAEKMAPYLDHCIGSNRGEPVFERLDRLAAEAAPGADGFFLDLVRQPYEEMRTRVADVAPRNVARALMEGIVYLVRNRIDELCRLTGKSAGRTVMTGGATKSPVWPTIVADVLDRPVLIPATGQYAGAMGAVMLAGMGSGMYGDARDAYERIRRGEKTIVPDPERSRLYQELYRDYSERSRLNHEGSSKEME